MEKMKTVRINADEYRKARKIAFKRGATTQAVINEFVRKGRLIKPEIKTEKGD